MSYFQQEDDSPMSPSKPSGISQELPSPKPIPSEVTFQSELQNTFKLFNNDRTIDKWSSFSQWVEITSVDPLALKNKTNQHNEIKEVYENDKWFEFYEDTAFLINLNWQIRCLALSSDQVMAVGLSNKELNREELHFFDSKSGTAIGSMNIVSTFKEMEVTNIIFGQSKLFVGCNDGAIIPIKLDFTSNSDKLFKVEEPFKHHSQSITSLSISKDLNTLLSTDRSGLVCLKSLVDKQPFKSFKINQDNILTDNMPVLSLFFIQNDSKIIIACEARKVKVFNIKNLEKLEEENNNFGETEEKINTMALSPKETKFAIAGDDCHIKICDLEKMTLTTEIPEAHEDNVNCLVFVDDKLLASGSQDKTIKIWNVEKKTLKIIIEGHNGPITCLAISSQSLILISGSQDQNIKGWKVNKLTKNNLLVGRNNEIYAIAAVVVQPINSKSPRTNSLPKSDLVSKSYVISVGKNKSSTEKDKSSAEKEKYSEGKDNYYEGKDKSSARNDKYITIWEKNSIFKELTWEGNCIVCSLAVNHDMTFIACGRSDGTIYLYDIKSKNVISPGSPFDTHLSRVNSIKFMKTNKFLVSAGEDKYIKIWNYEISRFEMVNQTNKHKGPITAMILSIDEEKIITGSKNSKIYIWDKNLTKESEPLVGHTDEVTSIAVTKDKIVSGGSDCKIIVWNSIEGEKWEIYKILTEHTEGVTCLEITSDYERIISVGKDKTLCVWNLNAGKLTGISKDFSKPITAMAIDHSNDSVITNGIQENQIKIVKIREVKTIKILKEKNEIDSHHSLPEYNIGFNPLTISSDGKYLASGDNGNMIKIRSLENNFEIKEEIKGHFDRVRKIKFTSDMKNFVSCSNDFTARIWQFDQEQKSHQISIFQNFGCMVIDFEFFDDEKKVVFVGSNPSVFFYNFEKREYIKKLENHTQSISTLAIDKKKHLLYTAGEDKTIQTYDLILIEYKGLFQEMTSVINVLLLVTGKSLLFVGCGDGKIQILSTSNQEKLISTLVGHKMAVKCLALNSKETILYSGGEDKTIQIWNLQENKRMALFEENCHSVNSIIIYDEDKRMISATTDQTISIWNLDDSNDLPFLEGHFGKINQIEATSDGKYAFSCSHDQTVIMWDVNAGTQLKIIEGFKSAVKTLALTKNKKLITACYDGNVKVWNVSSAFDVSILSDFELYTEITSIEIGNNDKELFLGGYDSFIRVYDLESYKMQRTWSNNAAIERLLLTLDNKKLVVAGRDRLIKLWNHQSNELMQTFSGHEGTVYALAWIEDKNKKNFKLVSGGEDKTMRIWKFDDKTFINEKTISGFTTKVKDIITTEDSIYIAFLAMNGVYKCDISEILKKDKQNIIEMKKTEFLINFEVNDINLIKNENETTLFVAGDTSIQTFHTTSQEKNSKTATKIMTGFSSNITGELLSPNREMIIFATEDNKITGWNLITNQLKFKNENSHSKEITGLVMTSNGNLLISASKDKFVHFYDIDNKGNSRKEKVHSAPINALALSEDETMIFTATKEEIKISKFRDNQINKKTEEKMGVGFEINLTTTKEEKPTISSEKKLENIWSHTIEDDDKILAITFFADNSEKKQDELEFLTGGTGKKLKLWNIKLSNKEDFTHKTVGILPETIKGFCLSPDKHILIVFLENSMMQIWNTHPFSFIKQLEMKKNNFRTHPVFLSNSKKPNDEKKNYKNRLMLYFDKIIDCYNGEIIFSFNLQREITSFFFNPEKMSYYYITPNFELYQVEDYWLQTYLFNYLKYDSLTNLSKDSEISNFVKRPMSTYPFFFSFMHLLTIFEKHDFFTSEIMDEVYASKAQLRNFFQLDIFLNTPLDVMILKKNTTLMFKYFTLFFMCFEKEESNFFDKIAFLNYSFKLDYDMLDLMAQIIELCTPNLSIISKLFDLCYMPLDDSIYSNSLYYEELKSPLFIITDSLYHTDSSFIEKELEKQKAMGESIKTIISFGKSERNASVIKAKAICIPFICDFSNVHTVKLFKLLSESKPDNEIFGNKTLELIAEYIWANQMKYYYLYDFLVFFVFFSLYNWNFLLVYPLRKNIYYDSETTQATLGSCEININIALIIYAIFSLINEVRQLFKSGTGYFKSIWNYFDITLIPFLIITAICDIYRTGDDISEYFQITVKTISSICMFCFWFRFLSFFRAVDEFSSMIRLIINVFLATRYFVWFMMLFMLTLSCSFYLLHEDNKDEMVSFWETFLVFYETTVGDSSGIVNYDLAISQIKDLFSIASTFVFSIILLNLLVSIIGDIHGEIKEAGAKTRLYENINILVDTNFSIITRIVKFFRSAPQPVKYVVYLYNEKHEVKEINIYESLEKRMNDSWITLNDENLTRFEKIDEKIEKIGGTVEKLNENFEKLKDYLENFKNNK